jgi:hypothetical protein
MFLFAVAATTLAVPTSIAAVTLAAGPASASGTLTCTKISGSGSGTVTIKKCNDTVGGKPDKTNKSLSGSGPSLVAGGTLTWSPSGETTIIGSLTTTSPGQGICPANWSEEDSSGMVSGGTSPYTHSGDTFNSKICVNKHLKVKLAPGTTLSL